ncbi:hypothetical protein IV498_17415 [Paenarthrobacter sp. Z7-10]|uniref:hypothetical protein n=1 Tax=Paenarthrobacter sp. Z7-10 TaxID=2787635 RepID=UPI0022A9AED8|nr:hypothetical protein [Paenarthrobacter sp. Z7-10]MCZ2404896.1 hypothetical protein [Paenarthrobacter sp. Z7-10]
MVPAEVGSPYILAEFDARRHRENRDYVRAASLAAEAAETARTHGDWAGWWNMTFLRGECLLEGNNYPESAHVASLLSEHALATRHPQLRVRALTLLTIALQASGKLDEAISAARTATAAVPEGEDSIDLWVHAHRALIGACAESGRLDEAWQECLILAGLMNDIVDDQTAGKAYWVIGNVAFLRNDPGNGQKYHDMAAELFSPGKDLDLWAKFNKASAAMRLRSEIVDESTLRCIERAELAAEVVGGSTEDALLLAMARAHWCYLTGDSLGAIAVVEPVYRNAHALAAQNAAEACFLLGQSLHAVGDHDKSRLRLQESADYFRQAGAPDREARVLKFLQEKFDLAES